MPASLIEQVTRHYQDAKNVLDQQIDGMTKRVDAYRGHIDSTKWPYKSRVFDPRVYTVIKNKNSRLFSQPPRGKVYPREGSDVASAVVVNELVNFQWDSANHFNGTMLEKYMLMDEWTRIHGASFALVQWYRVYGKDGKVEFDGNEMKVLRNVDCLPDPRATSIEDANWFQVVEYTTLEDLENTSPTNGRPTYKNLAELAKKVKAGVDQSRDSQYLSRNLEIWGIDDANVKDSAFKHLRIVTEYRKDRWITFSPDYNIIIRDIPNPYSHGKIPIIMLRYYPLGDSLYGLSEVEPVLRLQRAINSLVNQRIDLANLLLYPPIHVNPDEVRMHTLEWGSGKMWEMDRPNVSVQAMTIPDGSLAAFQSTYSLLVASLNNATGEQSVGTSNFGVFNPEKTATEVADIASIRNSRDVSNSNFLAETMKRQVSMWIDNDKDFLPFPTIVRIVGKQAIERVRNSQFADQGGSEMGLDQVEPRFKEIVPGELGEVKIFEDDMAGTFDYIPNVEAMSLPNRDQITELRRYALEFMLNPAVQMQMAEKGLKPDIVELLSDMLEDSGMKDARKYFERGQPAVVPGGQPTEAGAPMPGAAVPVAPPAAPPSGGMMQNILGLLRRK